MLTSSMQRGVRLWSTCRTSRVPCSTDVVVRCPSVWMSSSCGRVVTPNVRITCWLQNVLLEPVSNRAAVLIVRSGRWGLATSTSTTGMVSHARSWTCMVTSLLLLAWVLVDWPWLPLGLEERRRCRLPLRPASLFSSEPCCRGCWPL